MTHLNVRHLRRMISLAAVSLSLGLVLQAGPVRADAEAIKEFDQLFGEAVKQVLITPDAADDIALAKRLVEAARTATDKVALMTVMLEKAYDLCAKDPTGTATAVEAMEALVDRLPDRRVAATQKILALLQRDYIRAKPADNAAAGAALIAKLTDLGEAHASAGDLPYAIADYTKALPVAIRIKSPQEPVIRARIQALTHQNRVESQVSILQERILRDRNDRAAANDLITLYITELNKPAPAQQYLDIVTDEDTKKHVPVAAKDLGELSGPDLLAMGSWYEGLARRATSLPGKRNTLTRAESYLETFLEKNSDGELTKLQAELALKRVQAAIKELTPDPSTKEAPEKVFTFTGKPLGIEAEKAQSVEDPMKIERTGSASGGAYVWRPAAAGQRAEDGPGHVVFHVTTTEAVDVFIWARVRVPDEANNSFYLAVAPDKVTTGPRRRWELPTETRNWNWVAYTENRRGRGFGRFGQNNPPEPSTVRLEPGVNSIMIFPRAHGAQLDSIYITKTTERPR